MSGSTDEVRALVGKLQAAAVGHSYGKILSALVHVASANIIEAAEDVSDASSLSSQFSKFLDEQVSANTDLISRTCSCGDRS